MKIKEISSQKQIIIKEIYGADILDSSQKLSLLLHFTDLEYSKIILDIELSDSYITIGKGIIEAADTLLYISLEGTGTGTHYSNFYSILLKTNIYSQYSLIGKAFINIYILKTGTEILEADIRGILEIEISTIKNLPTQIVAFPENPLIFNKDFDDSNIIKLISCINHEINLSRQIMQSTIKETVIDNYSLTEIKNNPLIYDIPIINLDISIIRNILKTLINYTIHKDLLKVLKEIIFHITSTYPEIKKISITSFKLNNSNISSHIFTEHIFDNVYIIKISSIKSNIETINYIIKKIKPLHLKFILKYEYEGTYII